MFPSPYNGALSKTAALSTFLLFAGCGAGSGSSTDNTYIEGPHAQEQAQQQPDSGAAAAPPVAPAAPAASEAQPDLIATAASVVTTKETIRLATTLTALVPATIGAAPYWPAWLGVGGGKIIDGVGCFAVGQNHIHALISIYKDGKRLGFPDSIGRIHTGCYHAYEMHVHDVTGIIHMETDVPKPFKLGQWFSLWRQPLSRDLTAGLAGPVRFYIIEKGTITPYAGNPYDIEMKAHREVLIVTGTTMSVVPNYQWPAI
jgi:hypothetical protein